MKNPAKKSTQYIIHVSKRSIIVFLWIIGLLMVCYSTYLSYVKLPDIEADVYEKQSHIDLYKYNNFRYELNDLTAYLTEILLIILEKQGVEENDSDYSYTMNEYKHLIIRNIHFVHTMKTGEAYNATLDAKWQKMSINELGQEFLNIFSGVVDTLDTYQEELKELSIERDGVRTKSMFFQTIGLFLTTLGIILQLRWRL